MRRRRPDNITEADWKRYLEYERKMRLIKRHQEEAEKIKPANYTFIKAAIMIDNLSADEKQAFVERLRQLGN